MAVDNPTKYKSLLLFGAPGSGKGTQGSILGDIPGFFHISSGDLFRSLSVGSPLGRVFLDYSSRGVLVPDDFTVQLWREYMENLVSTLRFDPESDTLILDGIPRNVSQARLLSSYLDVRRIYYLDCKNKKIMSMRLKRRALRENRLDDASDEVIERRLYIFEAETAPVLDFYPPNAVLRIDTGRTPVEVLADLVVDMRDAISAVARPD